MKTQMKLQVAILTIFSSLFAFGKCIPYQKFPSNILKTIHNMEGPAGKKVEVKNVDIVRTETGLSLEIYIYSNRYIGNINDHIQACFPDEARQCHLNNTTYPAFWVGTDQRTGYEIYCVSTTVTGPGYLGPFEKDLYIGRFDQGAEYSNQGQPNKYFHIKY